MRNLEVLTADVNTLEFASGTRFDSVVSVELFEHMRNYDELLRRVATWMAPRATLFVHIFTHERFAYPFESNSSQASGDWMARHFFSGGMMPMDAREAELMPVSVRAFGEEEAPKWCVYWRVFFMACAELWGFRRGREWGVSHYLFERRQ